jgi:dTDP-4-dehydrorhamnose reductase
MMLLLGATGYIGSAFASELNRRGERFYALSRKELDYTRFDSRVHGFIETDPPNFSFRSPPCSFYSGTKALAEETMSPLANGYLWRLRIPFDELDNPRNYLTKVQTYAKVYNNVNSISHRANMPE